MRGFGGLAVLLVIAWGIIFTAVYCATHTVGIELAQKFESINTALNGGKQ